jgi:transposase
MPKACSLDLRERVIEAVEGGASRREAAARFEVSASSAVKWLQSWRREGGSVQNLSHFGSVACSG